MRRNQPKRHARHEVKGWIIFEKKKGWIIGPEEDLASMVKQ